MKFHFTDTIHEDNVYEEYMVFNNILVLKYYKDYRKEQAMFQKKKRYGDFWVEHNIYDLK